MNSTGFEQQDGDLSQVKIDEVLRLVSYIAAEVSSDDAVPCRIVLLVKLLFDIRSNVLLNVVLLESLSSTVHSILLHVFRHVGVLDDCLSVRHFWSIS